MKEVKQTPKLKIEHIGQRSRSLDFCCILGMYVGKDTWRKGRKKFIYIYVLC